MTQIMCGRIRQARTGNGSTEFTFKTKTKAVRVPSNYIPRYFPYISFTSVQDVTSLHVLHLTRGSLTRDAKQGDKRELQN